MKANELMVGDWVNTLDGISRVVYIAKYSGIYTDNTNVGEKLYSLYEINPIPLTPLILEKNGFVYNAIPFADGWEQFGLTLYHGGNGYRIDCGINVSLIIDCVHQLQHVLRLCGIEKEIEL